MAKKATAKGATKARTTGSGTRGRSGSGTSVARVSPAAGAASGGQDFNPGEAFIKLLQSPLVAELVAVAATAALAALDSAGPLSSGKDTRGKRAGKAVKAAGKAAAAAVGSAPAAPRSTRSRRRRRRLRPAQKRKPRAADVADGLHGEVPPGSTSSPRLVSTLIQPPGASQPAFSAACDGSCAGLLAVRRVGEDQVEGFGRAEAQAPSRRKDAHAIGCAELVGVAPDGGCGLSVTFDEGRAGCAARQGFETERAAASEQIGDAQILERAQPAGEHREQGFADAVARWDASPGPAALRWGARATRRR